jgi:23S rRNA pseudouridine1911/1915/1917 synthase
MKIPDDAASDRLDRRLAALQGLSRAEARRRIEEGAVYVDGRRCRIASRQVGPDVAIRLEGAVAPRPVGGEPGWVFRGDSFAVVSKPPGMPVQATRASALGTLEAWLRDQPGVGYVALHHRLDADARGLLAVALDRGANKGLAASFSQRTAVRRYRMLVHGTPAGGAGEWRHREGRRGQVRTAEPWTARGHGREMISSWRLAEERDLHGLLEARLQTGRTHQLRLQAAAAGHPIVGDRLYGFGEAGGLRLQAYALALEHPVTGEGMSWELEEPEGW